MIEKVIMYLIKLKNKDLYLNWDYQIDTSPCIGSIPLIFAESPDLNRFKYPIYYESNNEITEKDLEVREIKIILK